MYKKNKKKQKKQKKQAQKKQEQKKPFFYISTPDVTWRSFCCAFRIEIKLVPINLFKLGLWFAPFVTSLVYDVTKSEA